MIKLLALDLDGTLVNERLEISSRTLRVLQHLIHQTEVRVVLATGRMALSAIPFARTIGVRTPIIAYQGAMIRDFDALDPSKNQILQHTPIELPLAQEVLQLLIEGRYHTNVYINDSLFTTQYNEYAAFYARMAGVTPTFCDNLLEALTGPPTKMMAIDDARIDAILGLMQEHFPGRLAYCKSRSNFCEIIQADVSKWNALQMLATQWGIAPQEIMAIGDQGNDVSMISQAGIGVAMGNAPDDVKAQARHVTASIHEDGAAQAIERFILNGEPVPEGPSIVWDPASSESNAFKP